MSLQIGQFHRTCILNVSKDRTRVFASCLHPGRYAVLFTEQEPYPLASQPNQPPPLVSSPFALHTQEQQDRRKNETAGDERCPQRKHGADVADR